MTGPSFHGSGPELERLALSIGIKPALRIRVPSSRAAAAVERWRGKGLAAVADGEQVYVAREPERVASLVEAERGVRRMQDRDAPSEEVRAAHRELGRLLGYPACCVHGFLERLERGVAVRHDGSAATERFVAAEQALRRSARCHGRLNFLLARREALVPFDPCAFDCSIALRYAERLFSAYVGRRPEDAAGLRERLMREVTLEGPIPLTVRFAAF